jgi:ATP-dependent Clp protease protease subunit
MKGNKNTMKFLKYIIATAALLVGMTALATPPAKGSSVTRAKDGSIEVLLHKDNVVTLNDAVDSDSVARLMMEVKKLDSRLPSGDPIYLVINSPGGSIDAGIELIERLKNLNRKVHTINLFSASMGFQIAQGLNARLITEDGTLMSHKARGGFFGEFPGQLDSRYGYYLKRISRLDAKVVARTKGKHTKQSYAALIENEYWCDGAECVQQGLADHVVTVKCDKSLDGTRTDTLKFIFFGQRIVLDLVSDACPMNTGILDFEVTVNGTKVFNKENSSYYYDDLKLTPEQVTLLDQQIKKIVDERTQRTNVVKY